MNFEDASTAVAALDGQIALIYHRANPGHPYYADVAYCSYNEGLERGFVELFWFDRRIMAAYAETLTRVDVRSLISIERSDIRSDEESQVAYLGDDWEQTLKDRFVFPGPWDGLPDS